MSEYMKVPSDTFETIQMDAGIICTSFNPSTGAVSGIIGAIGSDGFKFASNPKYQDYGEDIGNIPDGTMQMLRITGYDPTASGNYKNVTNAMLKLLEAGAAYDDSGSANDENHIIPKAGFVDLNAFQTLYFVGNYSNINDGTGATAPYAGYMAVAIKNALNRTGFQWQTTKNGKGTFAFEFHGHYDLNNLDDQPFEYYIRKGTGTLASLTVTSEAGTGTGKSKITVSGYSLGASESFVYSTASGTAPSVAYGDDVSTWTALTNGGDITPTSGHTKITVAVKNGSGKAVGAGNATLTVAE